MDFDAERQPRTEAATAAAAAPHGTKYGTQYKEDSIGHGAPIRLAWLIDFKFPILQPFSKFEISQLLTTFDKKFDFSNFHHFFANFLFAFKKKNFWLVWKFRNRCWIKFCTSFASILFYNEWTKKIILCYGRGLISLNW